MEVKFTGRKIVEWHTVNNVPQVRKLESVRVQHWLSEVKALETRLAEIKDYSLNVRRMKEKEVAKINKRIGVIYCYLEKYSFLNK